MSNLYKLSELFNMQMGKTPARNNSKYWDNGIYPWISISDFSNNGKFIKTTKEKITDMAVVATGIKPISTGTVIMSFKLSIGKVAVVQTDESKTYSNEAIMAFEIKKDLPAGIGLTNEYLYYLLSSIKFDNIGNKAVMGKTLNRGILENIKVTIHSFDKQKKIVAVLDKITYLIDKQKQGIKKLDEIIKSRFVEMFGDPVNNTFGWEKFTLGNRCKIVTGNTPSRAKPENYGTYIEWIKSDNINTENTYISKAKEYLSEMGFQKCRFVDKGSLLMTCIAGSINSIGNVAITDRRVAFNQQINAIVPNQDEVLYIYWLMLLSKPIVQGAINMALKGILSKGQLSEMKFPFPPLEQQKQFAEFVEKTDKSKFESKLYIKIIRKIERRVAYDKF